MSFKEVIGAVESIREAQELAAKAQDKRIADMAAETAALLDRIEELEARNKTPGRGGRPGPSPQMKAFDAYLRTGEQPAGMQTKEHSIGGGAAAGGALVPEFISNEIVQRAIARSRLASAVRRTPTDTSDYVRLLNLRGQAAAWSSETGTRSNSATFQLREIRPTHGELFSVVPASNWVLQDSKFNLANMVVENAVDQFAKALEAAIITGTGTDQPTGVLDTTPVTTPDGTSPERAADTIQYISNTTSPSGLSILPDSLYDLYFSLKPEYRARAQWCMSSATLSHIRKLKGTDGHFLWQAGLGAGVDAGDGLLLGKPIITSESMQAIGVNNFPVFCGDLDLAYETTEIGSMTIIRDNVTVKGKTLFYLAQRFGGRIVDNDALKALRTL